jgi:hypothetical protein
MAGIAIDLLAALQFDAAEGFGIVQRSHSGGRFAHKDHALRVGLRAEPLVS